CSFNVKIYQEKKEFRLQGKGIGEKLDLKKHKPKTEAKAVTYHLMQIKEEKNKMSLRFLIDL
ncbi:archease, partial [Thermoproteota archaeon]